MPTKLIGITAIC